eukprot:scaffold85203_cov75-Cyclotella_meneghiniana.AAC.2
MVNNFPILGFPDIYSTRDGVIRYSVVDEASVTPEAGVVRFSRSIRSCLHFGVLVIVDIMTNRASTDIMVTQDYDRKYSAIVVFILNNRH